MSVCLSDHDLGTPWTDFPQFLNGELWSSNGLTFFEKTHGHPGGNIFLQCLKFLKNFHGQRGELSLALNKGNITTQRNNKHCINKKL